VSTYGVSRRDRVVNVDSETRIVGLSVAGDRNLRWVSGPTTANADLCAGNVPLRGTSNMQSSLLNTDEVLQTAVSSEIVKTARGYSEG
jgi:hypothetical protein